MKALVYKDETMGADYDVQDIPADMLEDAKVYHEKLVEKVSESDDKLLEKYLGGETITEAELKSALRKRCIESVRKEDSPFVPVVCGTAFKNKGVQPMLDAVVDYLPSPLDVPPTVANDPQTGALITREPKDDAPFSALVFKIMTDPFVGQLAFLRVYSGNVKSSDTILNSTKGMKERIGRLLKMHANKREEIKEVWAGDIAAAVGLKAAKPKGKIVEATAIRAYHDAKREALQQFERSYFKQLVDATNGNVAEISRRTGLQRTHVRKYLRLHGLREPRG
jgi:elongation factor G